MKANNRNYFLHLYVVVCFAIQLFRHFYYWFTKHELIYIFLIIKRLLTLPSVSLISLCLIFQTSYQIKQGIVRIKQLANREVNGKKVQKQNSRWTITLSGSFLTSCSAANFQSSALQPIERKWKFLRRWEYRKISRGAGTARRSRVTSRPSH